MGTVVGKVIKFIAQANGDVKTFCGITAWFADDSASPSTGRCGVLIRGNDGIYVVYPLVAKIFQDLVCLDFKTNSWVYTHSGIHVEDDDIIRVTF